MAQPDRLRDGRGMRSVRRSGHHRLQVQDRGRSRSGANRPAAPRHGRGLHAFRGRQSAVHRSRGDRILLDAGRLRDCMDRGARTG